MPALLRLLVALLFCLLALSLRAAAPAPLTLLVIDGAIGPANADYIVRGIGHARRAGSQAVILQVDTPGGLDTAMRSIIKAILTAPLPVIAYVAPAGARAASAGTYILYASHVAAMAPATNLGAATPVQLGAPMPGAEPGKAGGAAAQGAMERKQLGDAAAYLRGLAQLRGRNADWAERAVRESLSLPSSEALKLQVIDLVAPDLPSLLARLDGRSVALAAGSATLRTAGARIVPEQPDGRARLLMVLTNPSIALILLTIGVYGLLFEFMSPGAVAPGVIGALCLLLGLYGLQLPRGWRWCLPASPSWRPRPSCPASARSGWAACSPS
jgi:membrane-bound serine protease (ClpP class)